MTNGTGPYLAIAVLCERIMQEADGVISLIRVVDRITHTVTDPDPPESMPPTVFQLTAVIAMRSGAARGRYTVTLRTENPSGVQLPSLEMPVHFEGEERGANLAVNVALQADQEGLYWIDVLFEEDLMTRIPLRVIYRPQRIG